MSDAICWSVSLHWVTELTRGGYVWSHLLVCISPLSYGTHSGSLCLKPFAGRYLSTELQNSLGVVMSEAICWSVSLHWVTELTRGGYVWSHLLVCISPLSYRTHSGWLCLMPFAGLYLTTELQNSLGWLCLKPFAGLYLSTELRNSLRVVMSEAICWSVSLHWVTELTRGGYVWSHLLVCISPLSYGSHSGWLCLKPFAGLYLSTELRNSLGVIMSEAICWSVSLHWVTELTRGGYVWSHLLVCISPLSYRTHSGWLCLTPFAGLYLTTELQNSLGVVMSEAICWSVSLHWVTELTRGGYVWSHLLVCISPLSYGTHSGWLCLKPFAGLYLSTELRNSLWVVMSEAICWSVSLHWVTELTLGGYVWSHLLVCISPLSYGTHSGWLCLMPFAGLYLSTELRNSLGVVMSEAICWSVSLHGVTELTLGRYIWSHLLVCISPLSYGTHSGSLCLTPFAGRYLSTELRNSLWVVMSEAICWSVSLHWVTELTLGRYVWSHLLVGISPLSYGTHSGGYVWSHLLVCISPLSYRTHSGWLCLTPFAGLYLSTELRNSLWVIMSDAICWSVSLHWVTELTRGGYVWRHLLVCISPLSYRTHSGGYVWSHLLVCISPLSYRTHSGWLCLKPFAGLYLSTELRNSLGVVMSDAICWSVSLHWVTELTRGGYVWSHLLVCISPLSYRTHSGWLCLTPFAGLYLSTELQNSLGVVMSEAICWSVSLHWVTELTLGRYVWSHLLVCISPLSYGTHSGSLCLKPFAGLYLSTELRNSLGVVMSEAICWSVSLHSVTELTRGGYVWSHLLVCISPLSYGTHSGWLCLMPFAGLYLSTELRNSLGVVMSDAICWSVSLHWVTELTRGGYVWSHLLVCISPLSYGTHSGSLCLTPYNRK